MQVFYMPIKKGYNKSIEKQRTFGLPVAFFSICFLQLGLFIINYVFPSLWTSVQAQQIPVAELRALILP